MAIYFEEIWDFASACCENAKEIATALRLSANQRSIKEAREAELLADLPGFADLPNRYGLTAWAAILSVDLRDSSERALKLGPKPTYVTMHTYLPVMAKLVHEAGAVVVGLRGDGLFAAFGFEKISSHEETPANCHDAVRDAALCGERMITAVREVVSPVLIENGIHGDEDGLRVGVGVDAGPIVVTNIGFQRAAETTAYGPAINTACHLADGSNRIKISSYAYHLFPNGPEGKVTCEPTDDESFVLHYPPELSELPHLPSSRVLR
jgi:adenylate cyclase